MLFADRPACARLFSLVRHFIVTLGEVEIVPSKTQVAFRRRRSFAWVWLPQLWIKKQPEESIVLSIALEEKLADPRIKQVVEPRPGHFMHHIVITSAGQFDGRVMAWLRMAHQAASQGRRRTSSPSELSRPT